MEGFLPGALQPRLVFGIFGALQEFLVVRDGQDDGDGFAFAHDYSGFNQ
jgi:hypothetical protein